MPLISAECFSETIIGKTNTFKTSFIFCKLKPFVIVMTTDKVKYWLDSDYDYATAQDLFNAKRWLYVE